MECRKCGFDNQESTRFCGQCGSKLTGEDLPEGDVPELPILHSSGKRAGRAAPGAGCGCPISRGRAADP